MVDYSGERRGVEEIVITALKKGDNFIVEKEEGVFKALTDAYLSEDGSTWIVEAEDEDFEKKLLAVTKSNMGYAPKIGRVY